MQYILFSIVVLIILAIFIMLTRVYMITIGNISELIAAFFIDIWKRMKN